ncbi:hypothetical protein GCM10027082_20090 [Comamonas humi]
MPRQAIHAHAVQVQVPHLWHFTRAVNLPTIMQHGLYPIERIAEIGVIPRINDQHRWDGHPDSTSVSIAFPNSQMFYKYRQEEPEEDWAVLGLYSSILWEKPCAFCRHNAANARISSQPIQDLMTAQAFVGMYDEIEGSTPRADDNLKAYDPTDVQAEVLVFDVIEPRYIFGVAFDKEAVFARYKPHVGERKTKVYHPNKGFFANRSYVRKFQ